MISKKYSLNSAPEEQAFRLLFENHPIPMWVYDIKTLAFLEVNDAAVEKYGYTRDEFQALTIKDIRPSEDVAHLLDHLEEERPSLQHSGEWRHCLKNRRVIDVDITSHALEFEGHEAALVMAQDITERKRAENILRRSEERYHLLFDRMADGLYRSTHEGKFLDVNPAMVRMFGYASKEEMLKVDIKKDLYFAPEERGSHILDTGQEETETYRMRRKDGSEIWVEDHGLYVHDEQGNIIYHEGMLRDVTERKRAEEALRESESLLKESQIIAKLGSYVLDISTGAWKSSRVLDKIFGIDDSYIRSVDGWTDLIHPDHRQQMNDYFTNEVIGKRIRFDREYKIIRKSDQAERWVHGLGKLEVNNQNQVVKMLGTIQDVTDRKFADDALQGAEIKYRMLVERLPVVIYTSELGVNGTWRYISPQIEQLLGFTVAEWLSNPRLWYEQVHPEDRDHQIKLEEQAWMRQESFEGEYRMFTRDGRLIWIRDSAQILPPQKNVPPIFQGVLMDITERKKAEQALQESETLYRQAIEVAGAVPYYESYYDNGTRIKYEFIGEGIRKITGYGPEEFTAALWDSLVLDIHLVGDLADYSLDDAIQRVRSGEGPIWKCEHRIRARNGEIRWVFEAAVELRDEHGVSHGSIGMYQDVTERKRADEALASSEAELRALFTSMQDVVLVIDKDGVYRKIAPTNPNLLYKPSQEMLGKNLRDFFPADQTDKFYNVIQQVVKTRQTTRIEYALPIEDNLVWFATSISPMDADNTLWVARDITERKRAEQMQSALYEIANVSQTTISLNDLFVSIHKTLGMFMPSKNFYIAIYDAQNDLLSFPYFVDEYDEAPLPQKPGNGLTEYVLRTRQPLLVTPQVFEEMVNNKQVALLGVSSIDWMGVPLTVGNETFGIMVVQTYTDKLRLTQRDLEFLTFVSTQAAMAIKRKQTEEILRQFRDVMDESNDAIYFIDLETSRYIDFNKNAMEYIGYTADELRQLSVIDIAEHVRNIEDWRARVDLINEEKGLVFETNYRRKNGTVFPVEVSARLSSYAGKEIIAAVVRNITERKLAEEAIGQRLAEQSIIHQVSQSLLEVHLDPEMIYATLHQAVAQIMPCDAFNIVLEDKSGGDYHAVYLYDAGQRYPARRIPRGQGLSEKVISNGETLFIHDNLQSNVPAVRFGTSQSVRSILAVPLRKNNESVGMVSAQSYRPNVYNERHRVLLETLAAQITTVIENARLFEAERKQRQMSDALRDALSAGASMSVSLDFETILDRLLETLERVVPFEGGSIMLVQSDKQKIIIAKMRGFKKLEKKTVDKISEFVFDISSVENLRWVINNKQPLIISDVEQYPGWLHAPEFKFTRSWMGAPIIINNEVIALFSLESAEPNFFTNEHIELLRAFTGQASLALQNARLFNETARRAQEFVSLYETSNALSAENDLNTLLKNIVEHAVTLLNAAIGAVYLYNQTNDNLEIVVSTTPIVLIGTTLRPGEGMAGHVAQTRQPMRVENYSTWEGRSHKYDEILFHAVLEVPMLFGGDLIGVLDVAEMGDSNRIFTESDERLLSLFAAQAAGVLHSARLREETARRAQEFASLYETSNALSAENDLNTLLKNIVEHAATLLNTSTGAMYLYDRPNDYLEIVVTTTPAIPIGTTLRLGEGLAGRVAQSFQPMRIEDYSAWEGRSHKYDEILFRAILEVPMLFGGELIGVLNVAEMGDSNRIYTESDERLLSLFAAQAAGALHSARLREETARRAQEFASLYETSNALSAENELNSMLQVIVEHAKKLLGSASSGMYLYLSETDELELSVDTTNDNPLGIRLQLNEGVAGLVAQTHQPLRIDDYSSWDGRSPAYEGTSIRAVLEVPMLYGGELIGVLTADEIGDSTRIFTEADEHLLSLFASQAAGAIHSARLREQTVRRLDQLQALHTIDRAISSSFELHPILNTVISQTISQLGVDAANVLLFNPHLQTLEYVAGQGFHTRAIEQTQLRIGEDYAGRAAFERRTIHVPDLPDTGSDFTRASILEGEGFLEYYAVPLIAKGEVKGVLEVFHRSSLPRNPEWLDFLETLAGQAAITVDQTQLFDDLQRANLELIIAYDATIKGWSHAMDLRDKETEGHTLRVTEMTTALANAMGFNEKEMLHIRRGALLHDIGKMGIPDNILLKIGELTDDEWDIMRRHPQFAYEMLQPIKYLQQSLDIPYCHHEKWDGTGYPRGLKGEQIPLVARIFAVIDVWDAVTIDRPYRKAWTKQKALKYIRDQSGKHFEPKVVTTFLALFDTKTADPSRKSTPSNKRSQRNAKK